MTQSKTTNTLQVPELGGKGVWSGEDSKDGKKYGLDFTATGATFDRAVESTGFGKFHILHLLICGLIYLDTAVEITILSFVIPAAKCDFDMSSEDAGWLNAAPMLGMMFGSYFWGCLADTRGRKGVLIASLLLDGICGIASSFAQAFPIFVALRFFCGFGITGAMGIVFPYLGEFQCTKYREKVLGWMELFWTGGIIVLPLFAWGIIPLREFFKIETSFFWFHSWNMFVLVCSLPAVMLGLWLMWFPESPKFLLECGEYDQALEILRHMFCINSGKTFDQYPIRSLREKEHRVSVISIQSTRSVRSVKTPKDVKIFIKESWEQTTILFKTPHLKPTVLTCLIQFGLTSGYYTLMMWFPELFNRFDKFEILHPNETASVCDVSAIYETQHICDDNIDMSVYMHTLIIGIACIPTSFWLPLCVHRLGIKFFLVFCLLTSGCVALGFYFVQNSFQNLVLSAIFEALTSLGISVVYCVMVDLFPTNLRVMACALAMTFGRGGALFGNLIFGFLIDLNCLVPVVLFASFLYISGILCLFLPKTGQEELD
ncbi:synaptic vesicle glycoprotein 2B isoform X2 [Nilaparvata lugens]|uniref:synaptic vesicle glycoprotein 2B isoform X2 n=1 Tax=Nilaparvata lugens TaxID=108931 RepID=UPI000B994E93|nr:synaptic vesicle glycoprotein 2B isoform X2 [Nilaparvata lugens]XP_022188784.1 synaptic vesicle glycoprotein 2B isoform X2 [Nilaparvata lugens]